MIALLFSPAAEQDLFDIALHIARDDPSRAPSFVDELEATCASLRHYPGSGRERTELAEGLRSKPHGKYVIFYTHSAQSIRIERILHGARDVEELFGRG